MGLFDFLKFKPSIGKRFAKIHETDPETQRNLINSLLDENNNSTWKYLAKFLEGDDIENDSIRKQICYVLETRHEKRAVGLLIPLINNYNPTTTFYSSDRDSTLLSAAVNTLSTIGDAAAVDTLCNLINNRWKDIVEWDAFLLGDIAIGLAKSDDKRASATLAQLILRSDLTKRWYLPKVIKAIAYLGENNSTVIEALEKCSTKSDKEEIQILASEANDYLVSGRDIEKLPNLRSFFEELSQ